MNQYNYKIKDDKGIVSTKSFSIPDKLEKQFKDADKKYETSRNYIMSYWYHIWNKNYKDYLLYAGDREAHIKNWQSNVVYGIIRSTIENYASFASEKPLGYKATALNPTGFKNVKNVLNTLGFISDSTLFNREIQSEMIEALILGNFCFKTIYVKNKQTEKAVALIEDELIEYEFDTGINNIPKTVGVDIFKVFPDAYAGELRYITERDVVSHETFIKIFKTTLKSKFNLLNSIEGFDIDEIINFISLQDPDCTEDFGRVRSEVFRKINEELGANDTLQQLSVNQGLQTQLTPDRDAELTKGLIEYKCYTDNGRVIITANKLPVYIGKNPLGKINYHYGNTYHTKNRFSEGIGYLLRQIEAMGTSFLNTLIDGVRTINTPNFTAQKDLFLDPKQVEKGNPGDIWWTNGDARIDRVEKGNISDFGMLGITDSRGQTISGVSEYNSGISSKERVATAVASLVESTNRRILTFLKRFSNTISDAGYFQLYLARRYWTKPQWGYNIENGDQMEWETPISGKDLSGGFNISLETEGLLSVNKETEINKYLSMFDKFAGTGIINSSNLISDTFKAAGLDPNRYVINQDVTIPADKINQNIAPETPLETIPGTETTPTLEAQQMQQAINPQTGA